MCLSGTGNKGLDQTGVQQKQVSECIIDEFLSKTELLEIHLSVFCNRACW